MPHFVIYSKLCSKVEHKHYKYAKTVSENFMLRIRYGVLFPSRIVLFGFSVWNVSGVLKSQYLYRVRNGLAIHDTIT